MPTLVDMLCYILVCSLTIILVLYFPCLLYMLPIQEEEPVDFDASETKVKVTYNKLFLAIQAIISIVYSWFIKFDQLVL